MPNALWVLQVGGMLVALVLGITGGIATGKTTVTKMLGELGAITLSADDIAREVLAKCNPAYHEVVEHFGSEILKPDGDINREFLARIIFDDPCAREALNRITHPRIIQRMQEHIDRFRNMPPKPDAVLAVEVPLLMECGLEDMVDEVVVVAAEQDTQVNRLTSRISISREEAVRRISAQMPISEKVRRAKRVIWNDSSLRDLAESVEQLWKEIKSVKP
jgi:dephospho-CoA kinase